jgi:uncharacterized membrane protein (UPF0127 family)
MHRKLFKKTAAVFFCVALTLGESLPLCAGPVEKIPVAEGQRSPQASNPIGASASANAILPLSFNAALNLILGAPSILSAPVPQADIITSVTPLSATLPQSAVVPATPPSPIAAETFSHARPTVGIPPERGVKASPIRRVHSSPAADSLKALQRTVTRLKESSDSTILDDLYEITLPSRERLQVWKPRIAADKERGLMFRDKVPSQGMLEDIGADSSFHTWSKNTLISVDIVTLDSDGVIQRVLADVAPSAPGTPWRKVGLQSLKGRYVLTLPAGQALRSGLSAGMKIGGLAALPSMPRAPELARLILEDGKPGLQVALNHFKDNPGDYGEFDTVVGLIKHDRAAKARLYEAILRGETISYNYTGILAWHDPVLWFKHEPNIPGSLFPLPLTYPRNFVHEAGHYVAMRLFGQKIEKFRVYPSGGGFVSSKDASTTKNWQKVVIDLAGPAVEFAVGIMFVIASNIIAHPIAILMHGLGGSLPPHEIIAIGMAFIGCFYVKSVAPGARFDIANAAYNMGWTRLSAEISWRMGQSRYRIGRIYRVLFDLIFGESLGQRQSRSHETMPIPKGKTTDQAGRGRQG